MSISNPRRTGRQSRIQLIKPEEMTSEIESAWRNLRADCDRFASPYFDIEFTRAVAQTRDDVEIALVQNADCGQEITGILPFQRVRPQVGEPVGGLLNDVHGVIGSDSSPQLLKQIMTASQLKSFRFHALSNATSNGGCYEYVRRPSYHIDLTEGWESYQGWLKQHSSTVKRQPQKSRGLRRTGARIRFEFDCRDAHAMEKLIQLKREKYQRTRTFDILSVTWAANLLRKIHRTSVDGFQGLLSVLWADEQLVAAHFGMLTGQELHYWFPVFDPRFARYSPGTELILQTTRAAAERGVQKVDFGYGEENFKLKFCNRKSQVSCGMMSFSRTSFLIARQRFHLRNRLKRIPMKPVAKTLLRGVYPQFGEWNFR